MVNWKLTPIDPQLNWAWMEPCGGLSRLVLESGELGEAIARSGCLKRQVLSDRQRGGLEYCSRTWHIPKVMAVKIRTISFPGHSYG